MTRVLIIEDDPIIANIYRSRLDKEGFQVEIASDGQSGFYRVHESRPEAILLDLMLPKIDGLQILRKMRAQKQFEKTPIIVFTNAYVPNMVQEATQAGATQVFNKAAITPRHVIEALNKALFSHMAAPAPEVLKAPSPLAQAESKEAVAPPFPQASSPAPAAPPDKSSPTPKTPSSAAPAPEQPPVSNNNDAKFQEELLRSFLDTAEETINQLRRMLRDFLKAQDETTRQIQLQEFYRKVHAVTGNAAIVGLDNIAQLCSALEALIKELCDKPKNINASTMRSVAHGIDFLAVLLERGICPNILETSPPNILVVDDEVISRRAVTYALEKGHLKSEGLEDPATALQLVESKPYDLVILDVEMPHMTGFELCSKLRATPLNKNTPVLFVTSLSDFESRARSSLSGGNDLIAKPFLFIELTLKAITYVLKSRLSSTRMMTSPNPA